MPLAKNVMGSGISAMQARGLNGNNVNSAVTSAGTTQATATAITADVNVVSSASDATGVILYSGVPGDDQWVYNATASNIYVYPHSGGKINQASTNAGVVLPGYTALMCKLISSTQWVGILSA